MFLEERLNAFLKDQFHNNIIYNHRGDIVRNKKGQALIEFILILPVFLMLVLCAIDFGKIIYTQNTLENIVGDIVTLYKENKTYDEINTTLKKYDKKASLELVNDNNEYVKIILTKKVDLNAPGINLIINDPYTVKVSRVIYYEEQ